MAEEDQVEFATAAPSEGGSATAARAVTTALDEAERFVARFSEVARADACVGPAQTLHGHTVVPLATVSVLAGIGIGFGGGSDGSANEGSGGAGGGGGRGSSRVIAIIDISEQRVRVQPVLDLTSIALASMALLGLGLVVAKDKPNKSLLKLLRRGP